MIDEKNPVTSQALSDDDLDGVAGGIYILNGVTYNSVDEMPDDVRERYEQGINNAISAGRTIRNDLHKKTGWGF